MSVEARIATFGGGGFWAIEDAMRQLTGVLNTAVGYCGGGVDAPSYRDVASGATGHVESVRVQYDPSRVRYEDLVETFLASHDPTRKTKPAPAVGSQYRSVIFVHDAEQELVAKSAVEHLSRSGLHRRPVLTTIEPATTFHLAEEYHQHYLAKRRL